jgi:hypothetical protein
MSSIFQRTEKQRAAVRKLQGNPIYPIFSLGLLYFYGGNILGVLRTGQIQWVSRSHHNEIIAYADHPSAFTVSVIGSLFGILLGLFGVYVYFFVQAED